MFLIILYSLLYTFANASQIQSSKILQIEETQIPNIQETGEVVDEETKEQPLIQKEETIIVKQIQQNVPDSTNVGVAHDITPFYPYSFKGYKLSHKKLKKFAIEKIHKIISTDPEVYLYRLKYILYPYVNGIYLEQKLSFEKIQDFLLKIQEKSEVIDEQGVEKFYPFLGEKGFIGLLEPHAFITMLIFQKHDYGVTFWSDINSSKNEVDYLLAIYPNVSGQGILEKYSVKNAPISLPTGVYYIDSVSVNIAKNNIYEMSFFAEIKKYRDILFPEIIEKIQRLSAVVDNWDELSVEEQLLKLSIDISIQKLYPKDFENITDEQLQSIDDDYFTPAWSEFPNHGEFERLNVEDDFDKYLPYISFLLYYCSNGYMTIYDIICENKFNWTIAQDKKYSYVFSGFLESLFHQDKTISVETMTNALNTIEYPPHFLSTPSISEYASISYLTSQNINEACEYYGREIVEDFIIESNGQNKWFSGWDHTKLVRSMFLEKKTGPIDSGNSNSVIFEAGYESCMIMVFYNAVSPLIKGNSKVCSTDNDFNGEFFKELYSQDDLINSIYGRITEDIWDKTIKFVNMNGVCVKPNHLILSLYINLDYGRQKFVET